MNKIKKTIPNLLLRRATLSEEDRAIGHIENEKINFINFKQYSETVECLSLALINLGLTAKTKVCILSHTRKEWNFLDLAIMSSGAITVPIYPTYPADEIEYILSHCEAEFLILENNHQFEKILEIQNKLKSVKKIITLDYIKSDLSNILSKDISLYKYDECLSLGSNEAQKQPEQFTINIENIMPEDVATIVYTSGTTGQPKGAVIKHQALFQVLLNIKRFTHSAIYKEDRLLTYLPLSHVLGRLESFLPLVFGCEAVYAESMKKLIHNIPLVQPTLLMAVPRVLEKIYEKAQEYITHNEVRKNIFEWAQNVANDYYASIYQDKTPKTLTIVQYQLAQKLVFEQVYNMFGGKIRYLISGGAPLNVKIIKFLRNSNLTVLEGYGLTETVAPCCLNPLNKQVPGTVGQPIGDVEIKFLDDGEILIKSTALFSEYYKDPEATAQALDKDGWFHTGDIGSFDGEGFLRITDRKKDIIITSGGKNIAPQKIEGLLKDSQHITHCVIIGNQQKYLTALIGIDKEVFEPYFEKLEIADDCNYNELANHPAINSIIQAEIDKVNEQLGSYETIKKFKIIPAEISTDNYLTPSLKIKKKLICKDYSNLIEAMYKNK